MERRRHFAMGMGWGLATLLLGMGAGLWAQGNPRIYAPFSNLPVATRQAVEGQAGMVSQGTGGMTLPAAVRNNGGRTIAIVGDLAPVNGASAKYVQQAVRELNLLSPEAVFTVGDLVPGLTRSGPEYAEEVLAVRGELDRLKMPWYPCVGQTDVTSGERDAKDRRFEELYRKYFGPLYYSVRLGEGDVHVIVLDSEEGVGAGNTISDAQLAWLKTDLNAAFGHARKAGGAEGTQYVVVLVHRPLWREGKEGSWQKVHELLVEFNRRPIVHVEGVDAVPAGIAGHGPRVVAVIAGGTRAYADEGLRDGIRYTVVGATAARLQQDAAVDVRGFTLIKFDAGGDEAGVHTSVVEMGGDGPGGAAAGTIAAANVITAQERAVLEKIQALPNEALGVVGVLEPAAKKDGELRLMLENPLAVPLDVELRLASTRNLSTATLRENANPYVESFDTAWELAVPYLARHLEPGTKERYRMNLTMAAGATEMPPPQVEFVVHWTDGRGRVHDILLKRRVPIVPYVDVPERVNHGLAADWSNAAGGGTFVWDLRGDEPLKRSPEWGMIWDGENLLVRVRVEDAVHSYSQRKDLDWKWGGIGCDAVSVAWAANSQSKADRVQRVWVVPFGPIGAELWSNKGVGEKQSALQPLDERSGVKAQVETREDGYTVTLAIPRKMVMNDASACVMNISVADNDGGARTWTRSWAKDELGPAGWGRVTLKAAETQPATQPAPPRPKGKR